MKWFNWSYGAFKATMLNGHLTLKTHSKTQLIMNANEFAGDFGPGKMLRVTIELVDDEEAEVMKR